MESLFHSTSCNECACVPVAAVNKQVTGSHLQSTVLDHLRRISEFGIVPNLNNFGENGGVRGFFPSPVYIDHA